MCVGEPLDTPEAGRHTQLQLPLVKTIGRTPDFTRDTGSLYVESIHYVHNNHLIPFRSKVRSGLGASVRFTHLPSLNLSRSLITGFNHPVIDPRADIITDMMLRDNHFHKRPNMPLREWITEELTPKLAHQQWNEMTFDVGGINQMIARYKEQIHRTHSELTQRSLGDIAKSVVGDFSMVLPQYTVNEPIQRHRLDFANRLVPCPIDFKSYGELRFDNFSGDKMEYNPFTFQSFCDLLDAIPLSDFNVDVIVDTEGEIRHYIEHLAHDRIGMFQDNDTGIYAPTTLLKEYFDRMAMNDLLRTFAETHGGVTPEIEDVLSAEPVKIKLMKTITDEAAILVYRYDSGSDAELLCGVYFDIAAQSLSPMSIMHPPIPN
jgi:hypothetical protein